MAIECASTIDICALRVTRLDDDGSPAAAPNNVYVVRDLLQLQITENNREGQSRELLGGCGGCVIARRDEEDQFVRYDLEIQAGRFEPGLIEMLTGRTAILDTTDIVGVHGGKRQACGDVTPRVAIEAWSTRWLESEEQDPDRPWFRSSFFRTSWVLGQNTLSADFSPYTLTGKSRANSQWGLGPHGDQVEAAEDGDHAMFWADDTALPTGTCDYSDVVVAT